LELVKAKVSFSPNPWGGWRANFQDGAGYNLSLKVTYSAILEKLDRGDNVAQTCLLTVSLAGPWAPPGDSQPKQCYKLVAGVIEL